MGAWKNNPTAWTYRWQDCTGSGHCKAIAGATGRTYIVRARDIGYRLVVVVSAHNAAGTASDPSGPTPVVTASCSCSLLRAIDGGPRYFANLGSHSAWADSKVLLGGFLEEPASATDVAYDAKMGNNVYWNLAGPSGGGSVDYNVIRCPSHPSSTDVCADGMHVFAPTRDATTGAETIGWAGLDEADLRFGSGSGGFVNDSSGDNVKGCSPSSSACGYSAAGFYYRGAPLPVSGPAKLRYPIDGRAIEQGMGESVLFFAQNPEAARFMAYSDIESADSYWISAGPSLDGFTTACRMVPLADPRCADYSGNGTGLTSAEEDLPANYAYNVTRLEYLDRLEGKIKPIAVDVETDCPFAAPKPCTTPPQMTASAWHALIAGARGIIWFQQDFGSGCPTDYDPFYDGSDPANANYGCHYTAGYTVHDMVAAVTAFNKEVAALNEVLLSPFADGEVSTRADVSVMAKAANGNTKCWLFAGAGQPARPPADGMAATFSLANRYSGPVAVYGEGRTVTATDGEFTDAFANANAVHIYEIPAAC